MKAPCPYCNTPLNPELHLCPKCGAPQDKHPRKPADSMSITAVKALEPPSKAKQEKKSREDAFWETYKLYMEKCNGARARGVRECERSPWAKIAVAVLGKKNGPPVPHEWDHKTGFVVSLGDSWYGTFYELYVCSKCCEVWVDKATAFI